MTIRLVLAFSLLALSSCRLDVRTPELSEATFGGGPCVMVTTAEFGVDGALARVSPDTLGVDDGVTTVHHDTRVVRIGDDAWALERLGADAIRGLDGALATRWTRTLESGANPADASARGGRVLVSLPGSDALALLSLDGEELGREGLSAFADDDGASEPDRVLATQSAWWVTLQRLESFRCSEASPLLVRVGDDGRVDEARSITLPACNPVDAALLDDERALVALAGVYRSLAPQLGVPVEDDGGLALVDLTTGSAELIFRESDLDGDVSAVVTDGARAWLLVSDDAFMTRLVGVDLLARSVIFETHLDGGAFDLLPVDDDVWVASRSITAPGVYAFDAASGEPTAGPMRTLLPPYELLPLPSCVDGPESRTAASLP